MKNHIFLCCTLLSVFSSCSDDSNIKTEREIFIETKNLMELNFIPTIESYFGKDQIGTAANRSSSLSGLWIHQFDGKGRLIMSQLFEKYPNRILKEILYSDYDIETFKVNLEVHVFNYYTFVTYAPEFVTLNFDKSYIIKGISLNIPDGGSIGETVFEELNDNKWVTLVMTENYYLGYEYDAQGNILKYISYDENLLVKSTVDYTYTEFGDLKSYYFQNTEGNFAKAECLYRIDNTLERIEESFDYGNDFVGKSELSYSFNETDLKRITDYENGSREIHFNYGDQIVREYYTIHDKLGGIYKYRLSENGRKFYLEEYENYDENGELEYTEFYDDDGNLTETVYE